MMITFRIFWNHMGLIINKGLAQFDGIVIIPPASEPPDQAPFLPASRFSLHTPSAVPVLKGTSTAWTDAFFFTGY